MTTSKISLGKKGESLVAEYLLQNGFSIAEQNYSSKYGEIDIIATKDDLIAFVEVKLRTNPLFNISQVIVPTKQAKIVKTAQWYIFKHRVYEKILRFDAALIVSDGAYSYKVEYIENAFSASE